MWEKENQDSLFLRSFHTLQSDALWSSSPAGGREDVLLLLLRNAGNVRVLKVMRGPLFTHSRKGPGGKKGEGWSKMTGGLLKLQEDDNVTAHKDVRQHGPKEDFSKQERTPMLNLGG